MHHRIAEPEEGREAGGKSSERKESAYTCVEGKSGGADHAEVRRKRSSRVEDLLHRDAGKGLYALSLVLRGSHGFQAGIFSTDRQRGRNGWRTRARWEAGRRKEGKGERRLVAATARVSSDASPHLSVRI